MSSRSKAWFECADCFHKFERKINNIQSGCWCPVCKHKTESKLYEWLKQKFDTVYPQKTFEWTKTTKNYRRYDFHLPELNILIELGNNSIPNIEKVKTQIIIDGLQHFVQVWNWTPVEETQLIDRQKNELAIQNNHHIIRIFQESVLKDKENWRKNLENTILELSQKTEKKIVCIGEIYDRSASG